MVLQRLHALEAQMTDLRNWLLVLPDGSQVAAADVAWNQAFETLQEVINEYEAEVRAEVLPWEDSTEDVLVPILHGSELAGQPDSGADWIHPVGLATPEQRSRAVQTPPLAGKRDAGQRVGDSVHSNPLGVPHRGLHATGRLREPGDGHS